MRVLKTVAARHPKSFDNVYLSVSAHRDVFMTRPNGGEPVIDIVTSKVMLVEEFKEAMEAAFGPLKFFDHFVDPDDGYEVVRGMVFHDGVQKVFMQRYDELTEKITKDIMSAIGLTKRLDDQKEVE